ncbi:branched-chain amino acid ABC transporter permease [Pyrobaculum ferrireducens]|jgi:branched-chain amino acid transport system permease protein|uniref:Branched-chain amino acid transport permease protein n=1 Tax=Pyrobaculum ferrireducens TaxID=1104324 RepID=G7VCG5_9CREN|nr:branched-chain amino acid ABC transporter permease [Pyrobaculum ferrireducens]AET32585.1 hypothetical protein P186_1152 [Pyrobaculum ferrireducens]
MIDILIDGVLRGGVYAIAALGYVLVYRASKVVNLAHGTFALTSAYLFWALSPDLGPVGALIAIIPLSFILAAVVERAVVRPMLGEPVIQIIAATIGVSYLLKGLLLAWLQVRYALPGWLLVPFEHSLFPRGFLEVAGLRLDFNFAGSFLASLASFGFFYWFYKNTSLGVAMRAMSNDRVSAVAFGIKSSESIAIAWALSGILAALAGVFYASIYGGASGQVEYIGIKALPVIILGGLDSVGGALVAGVAIGVLEVLGKLYLEPLFGGGFGEVFPLLFMIAVLLVRPYGLFGTERIERV